MDDDKLRVMIYSTKRKERCIMAVRTFDDLMTILRDRTADMTDDETLNFIADVNDTLTNYEDRLKDQTDWKDKYEKNDAEWRTKYKERFFSGGTGDNGAGDGGNAGDVEEKDDVSYTDYNDLFKEE